MAFLGDSLLVTLIFFIQFIYLVYIYIPTMFYAAFLCYSIQIRDSKPQFVHVQRSDTVQKFKLRISERGANFDEKVEIDEKNDMEYFQVPPHNELSETDAIYDFRMVSAIVRIVIHSDRQKSGNTVKWGFESDFVQKLCLHNV